ncbi:MAG: TonB-dependent receptor, partial [Gammaproteobacteria bacterium]|nr:TonB-dependent receptor [Gammaproteobacteria bacterium]
GSDAIGGVVNIITRKDMEGVNLTAQVSQRDIDNRHEYSGSITGGITGAKGNITFAIEHTEKEMMFNGDVDFAAVGLSAWGYPGTFVDFNGTFVPDPRCPATLGGSSEFPSSVNDGTFCRYNYAATSANEAAISRDSIFVKGDFEINENTTFFARAIQAQNSAFGRYAPTPFIGSTPFLPTIAANHPNNPTGVTGSFFYRNVEGGFRDTFIKDDLLDVVLGFEGTTSFMGGAEWDIGFQYSRNINEDTSTGLGSFPALQTQIDNGILNPFGNIDLNTIGATVIDGYTNNESITRGFDGTLRFDILQDGNHGAVPVAIGFEYREEKLSQDFDSQQNASAVAGSAGGSDVFGKRDVTALFAEARWPIGDALEINTAVRYDDYSDFGSTWNPKVSALFTPTDNIKLRATYGEGFRAPALFELYSANSQSFDAATDTLRCDQSGQRGAGGLPVGHPCISTQYQNLSGGNPDLDPEESTSYTLGVAISPTDDLTFSVDYYNVEYTQEIGTLPIQTILDIEAQDGSSPLVIRDPNTGRVQRILANNTNLSGTKTDGVDFGIDWNLPVEGSELKFKLLASHVLNYEREIFEGDGFQEVFGAKPDTRIEAGVTWTRGDWSANLKVKHMTESEAVVIDAVLPSWTTLDAQVTWTAPWGGTLTLGARNLTNEKPPCAIPDPDQAAEFGCEDSSQLEHPSDHPYYDNQRHNIYGRVAYIRYSHDF